MHQIYFTILLHIEKLLHVLQYVDLILNSNSHIFMFLVSLQMNTKKLHLIDKNLFQVTVESLRFVKAQFLWIAWIPLKSCIKIINP